MQPSGLALAFRWFSDGSVLNIEPMSRLLKAEYHHGSIPLHKESNHMQLRVGWVCLLGLQDMTSRVSQAVGFAQMFSEKRTTGLTKI